MAAKVVCLACVLTFALAASAPQREGCTADAGLGFIQTRDSLSRAVVEAANPCERCAACVAVPSPSQSGVNDDACRPCALGGQSWWPCNTDPAQCQCTVAAGPTPAPQGPVPSPTSAPTPIPSSATPEPVPAPMDPSVPCRSCSSCMAVPRNTAAATDQQCAPCAMDGQSYWPCQTVGLCQCGTTGPVPAPPLATPTPAPTVAPMPEPTAAPTPAPAAMPTPAPPSPPTGQGIGSWFSAAQYANFFPNINTAPCTGSGFFTYQAFLTAAASYPGFADSGDLVRDKLELAAFLGQTSHETTGGWPTAPGGPYAWGYCWKEEVGCENGGCTQYCQAGHQTYPCSTGQTYQGRGPMQLSWNYNYGAFSEAAFGDKQTLLDNPALVASDPVVAYKAALWFWMTAQAPKPSCHAVMQDQWQASAEDLRLKRVPGFGMTTNIINGGLECNQPTNTKVKDRVGFFKRYAGILGASVDENTLYCDKMTSYR